MKKVFSVLLILALSCPAFAGPGGMPFEILAKGVGIRALAMGEAGTANCEDATSVFWNPAFLDNVSKNSFYASLETFFDAANLDYISYAGPAGAIGGFGISAGIMNYGEYDMFDTDGNPLGTGDMRDIFVTGAFGTELFAGVKGGVAAKAVVKVFGTDTYTGFNADIGIFKSFSDIVDCGIVFKNALPLSVQYSSEEEKFVPSVKAGITARLLEDTLKIAVDTEKYLVESDIVFYSGIEYMLMNMIALRAGFNTNGNFGGGIGAKYNDIGLDYAFIYNELSPSHKVALSYSFGGYELSLRAEPDVFSPLGGNKKTYIRVTANAKFEIYKWKLEIKNSAGKTVKEWHGAGEPDPSIVWDGLGQWGMPEKDGIYKAFITVVDVHDVSEKSKEISIKISSGGEYQIPIYQ